MTRVVLCTPSWSYAALAAAGGVRRGRPFGRDVSGQGVLPSLGLHYLGTSLEGHGHVTEVIEGHGLSRARLVDSICARRPEVVGVTVVTALWAEARALLADLKRKLPHARLAAGGPHATLRGKRLLVEEPNLDAVFVGPAEDALRRWVDAGAGQARCTLHPGDVEEHQPGWASRLAARVPWQDGVPNLLFLDHPRFATTVTSTGCARSCAFCAVSMGSMGGGKARPTEEILEEWRFLARVRRIRSVNVMDDDPVFVRPGAAAEELLEALAEARLGLRWSIYLGRFDLDEARLRLLARAGCTRVLLMAESGVERVLTYVKGRPVDPSEVAGAAERIGRAGMEACARFQFGFPGETVEDGRETIRFACSLPLSLASFIPAMLYPGSRMAKDLERSGRLSGDETRWSFYGRPFVPDAMSEAEQATLVKQGIRSFYGRPRGIAGLARLGHWPTVAGSVLLDGAT